MEITGCFGFAKLNENINKTEITKIEIINNQIYTLKSGSIKNNSYFCVKSTRSAIFGPIWASFRSKQLKIWPGSYFCSQIDLIEWTRSNRLDQIDSIELTQSN